MAKVRKKPGKAKPRKSKAKARPRKAKPGKPPARLKAKKRIQPKARKKPAPKIKKAPAKKAARPPIAIPSPPRPAFPAVKILPEAPQEKEAELEEIPGEGKPEEEKAPEEERAPAEVEKEEKEAKEEKAEKITPEMPEEAPPPEEKEEAAPPEEEEKEAPQEEKKEKRKKPPEEELTPEEKIELMFPEEKPSEEKEEAEKEAAPAEEKPEEKPEGAPAEEKEGAHAGEEKPEAKTAKRPEAGAAPPEKPAPALEEAPREAAALALEMLPSWEDRRRLRKVIDEEGYSFSMPEAGSPDFKSALKLLSKSRKADAEIPGRVLVCAKDRFGKLAGATDGFVFSEEEAVVLVMSRAAVFGEDDRKDLHMLMHGVLLGAAKPTHVACCTEKPDLSQAEEAGRLIFYGRGFGMSAIPIDHPKLLCFMRRVGKEHSPATPGQEVAMVLHALNSVRKDEALEAVVAEFSRRESVSLVMLPASPDPGEHMHELKDALIALGLPTARFDSSFAALESQYLRGRADITPASLF